MLNYTIQLSGTYTNSVQVRTNFHVDRKGHSDFWFIRETPLQSSVAGNIAISDQQKAANVGKTSSPPKPPSASPRKPAGIALAIGIVCRITRLKQLPTWVPCWGISSTFILKHLSRFLKSWTGYLGDIASFWMFLWSNISSVGFFSFYLHFHLLLWQKLRCTHSIKQLSHTPATLRFLLLCKRFPSTVFIAKDPININGASILFIPKGFI